VEAKHRAWVTSWTTRLDPDLWRPEATPEKRIEKVDGSVKGILEYKFDKQNGNRTFTFV